MTKIPKIIHQIFFQGEDAAPKNYRRYHQTVIKNHPNWEHYFWDEAKSRNFIQEKYSWFLEIYDSYPYMIQRCDSIRYFILDYYGGFYIDMDVESLKAIDNLLEDFELVLSKLVDFNNAIIGSIPHHPIWIKVFEELQERQKNQLEDGKLLLHKSMPYHVCYTTGPMLLHDCVVAGKFNESSTTRICPGYIFEPGAPMEIDGKIIKSNSTENSYTIHHMTTHWLPLHHRITSKIFRFFTNIYWKMTEYFSVRTNNQKQIRNN
ncbi:MAG: glycosyltransferase [Cyanobacteria bacterium J06633_8]